MKLKSIQSMLDELELEWTYNFIKLYELELIKCKKIYQCQRNKMPIVEFNEFLRGYEKVKEKINSNLDKRRIEVFSNLSEEQYNDFDLRVYNNTDIKAMKKGGKEISLKIKNNSEISRQEILELEETWRFIVTHKRNTMKQWQDKYKKNRENKEN